MKKPQTEDSSSSSSSSSESQSSNKEKDNQGEDKGFCSIEEEAQAQIPTSFEEKIFKISILISFSEVKE